MRKYSDFSCASCNRDIKDLPLEAKACPLCGKRRGFKRIYASQISTKGHRIGRFVDRRLQPAYDAKSKKESTQFEKEGAVALEKAWELAPTEQREAAVAANGGKKPEAKMQMHSVAPAAAMGMIDPQARRDTREMVWPMVNRRIVPTYQR